MATFELSVHRYIQLARMKRASYRHRLRGCPKRHGHSAGCRLRCTGRLRPRLSATVRAIAFVVPESPDGSRGLRPSASRQREEQAHAEDFYPLDDVTIRDVPPTRVAIMEHRGDPATLGATIQRSSRGARPLACTPRQVRPSTSGVPSGVLRRLPIIAWTFVPGPTNRSRRTASRSKPATSLADAARCCASSATPTIWSPPRSTFIAAGFRPAARKHATSRSIASG